MNLMNIKHLVASMALLIGVGLVATGSGVARADTPSITVAYTVGGVNVLGSSFPAGDVITLNVYATSTHLLVGRSTTTAGAKGSFKGRGNFSALVTFDPEVYCYSGRVLVEAVDMSNPLVRPVNAFSPYVPC